MALNQNHLSQDRPLWTISADTERRIQALEMRCFLKVLGIYSFAGLVVKVSALGAKDPGFESRLRRDFSGSNHASDLIIGTPVATLPGAWNYRVSAGTGRPVVSIL